MKIRILILLCLVPMAMVAQCDDKPIQFKRDKAILDTSCYTEIAVEYNRLKQVEYESQMAISNFKDQTKLMHQEKAILIAGLSKCDFLTEDLHQKLDKESDLVIRLNAILDMEKTKKNWWAGGGVVGGLVLAGIISIVAR